MRALLEVAPLTPHTAADIRLRSHAAIWRDN
jgi:hypothetical protein